MDSRAGTWYIAAQRAALRYVTLVECGSTKRWTLDRRPLMLAVDSAYCGFIRLGLDGVLESIRAVGWLVGMCVYVCMSLYSCLMHT